MYLSQQKITHPRITHKNWKSVVTFWLFTWLIHMYTPYQGQSQIWFQIRLSSSSSSSLSLSLSPGSWFHSFLSKSLILSFKIKPPFFWGVGVGGGVMPGSIWYFMLGYKATMSVIEMRMLRWISWKVIKDWYDRTIYLKPFVLLPTSVILGLLIDLKWLGLP